MRARSLVLAVSFALGCGGSPPPRPAPAPAAPAPSSSPAAAASATVSTPIRRDAPKQTPCGAGDVCGFFLQVVSPGSDPTALANKVAATIKGKCGGQIIVYRDARKVMGSGTVLATADEKRACERALGRDKPDTDFPSYAVFQVAK